MSLSIGASLPGAGKVLGADLATPAERQGDQARAAQDAATETQSQGLARQRTILDQLADRPSALARFTD